MRFIVELDVKGVKSWWVESIGRFSFARYFASEFLHRDAAEAIANSHGGTVVEVDA